jgi:hypothetical protein
MAMKLHILGALVAGLTVLESQAGVAHFLVGPVPRHPELKDSYVLPLTRPEDIAEARKQLTIDLTNRLMVVARIGAGADGINRDHLAPGKRAWSWHVTEFLAFADGGIPETEVSPTGVEANVAFWTTDPPRGIIGSASYRVVTELTPEQIFFTSASLTAGGVRLHWLDLGTNYLYTAESTASLSPPQWTPVPGIVWPIAATNCVDAAAATNQPRFYRVKAELRTP